jgi:hypothetical protein
VYILIYVKTGHEPGCPPLRCSTIALTVDRDGVSADERLCRLLRNRVSAQQARERKKLYVSKLESKIAEQGAIITHLREELQNVAGTNSTLRRLLLTMRGPPSGATALISRSATRPAGPSLSNRVLESSPPPDNRAVHSQPRPHAQAAELPCIGHQQQPSSWATTHQAGRNVHCTNAPHAVSLRYQGQLKGVGSEDF